MMDLEKSNVVLMEEYVRIVKKIEQTEQVLQAQNEVNGLDKQEEKIFQMIQETKDQYRYSDRRQREMAAQNLKEFEAITRMKEDQKLLKAKVVQISKIKQDDIQDMLKNNLKKGPQLSI